jgi:hypothetical protein
MKIMQRLFRLSPSNSHSLINLVQSEEKLTLAFYHCYIGSHSNQE